MNKRLMICEAPHPEYTMTTVPNDEYTIHPNDEEIFLYAYMKTYN